MRSGRTSSCSSSCSDCGTVFDAVSYGKKTVPMKRKHSVALVAGGGGLIGTHLCRALLEKGFEVICADIRTGNQVGFPQDVRENGRFRYIRHDVVNPFNIHCDAVFNLASRTDVGFTGKHPVQTLKTDIIGCLNTLDVAKSNNAVYVFASSSDVYGISNANSYNETATGNIPASFPKYTAGTGKRAAEGLCESYRSEFGMDVKVARLFNTYGPEMDPDDGRIISKFLSSALQNKDLLVYGSGGQTRSFCWVGDTVDALIRIMECRDRALSPVNIGSSHEITINALAKRIIELTGSRSKIIHVNSPADMRRHETPDVTKARRILSWIPSTSLDEGLRRCVEYMESRLGAREKAYAHWM